MEFADSQPKNCQNHRERHGECNEGHSSCAPPGLYPAKRWSRKYDRCIRCGSSERKYCGNGLCTRCYLQDYQASHPTEMSAYRDKYYRAKVTPELQKQKREQRHFDSRRDAVLKRDKNRCTSCGKPGPGLIVHHIDGNGRGSRNPNNAWRNLITLCRACHMKAHWESLFRAKRLVKKGYWSKSRAACLNCGRNDRRHAGYGMCNACYARLPRTGWYLNPQQFKAKPGRREMALKEKGLCPRSFQVKMLVRESIQIFVISSGNAPKRTVA